MEEINQKADTMQLVQKLGTYNYKIVIPVEVERKIRFACKKVWSTEWSGTLFFTHEGSFENNDLVIKCVDIYIMDIGTQAYTEFDMSPDVISYMCDHPELLDCQMGLIHSHNNMSTFFSGTDTATLKEEGRDRNNFVSLIVNNAGTYTAAITRKVKKSKNVEEVISYEFFGDGVKDTNAKYTHEIEEIEWFYLKVEKENDELSFPDMELRLEEIKKNKEERAKRTPIIPTTTNSYSDTVFNKNSSKSNADIKLEQKATFKEGELPFRDEVEIPYGKVFFNKSVIRDLLIQTITGSVVVSKDSKLDIEKWAKAMPNFYKRRFGEGKEGFEIFEMWAETFMEFLVYYTKDEDLYESGFDETEIAAICAHDLIDELTKLPENDYIKGYIDTLERFLVL